MTGFGGTAPQGNTTPLCDFCNSPEVRWAYPTDDFSTEIEVDGQRGPEWGSHGGWAACDACSRLIEAGDREKLARRCAKKLPEAKQVGMKALLPHLRKLHEQFFAKRRGERVPCDPDDPHDPTRDDPYGRMLALPGTTHQFEVSRSPEVMAEQPATSFSEEAVEFLDENAQMWMLSRIARRVREGRPPRKAAMYVSVGLDGSLAADHRYEASIYEYCPTDLLDPERFLPMVESDAMVLVVPITQPADEHDENEVRTLLDHAAGAWVMSRIMRAWKEKPGHTFGKCLITVGIDLDGEGLTGQHTTAFISYPDTGHRNGNGRPA